MVERHFIFRLPDRGNLNVWIIRYAHQRTVDTILSKCCLILSYVCSKTYPHVIASSRFFTDSKQVYRVMTEHDHSEVARINNLLKKKILHWLPNPGKFQTRIEGLTLAHRTEVNQAENIFGKPSVGVVVQGAKCSVIGSQEFRYGEGQCCVSGVDMPSAFYVLNPSAKIPFLSIGLELDKYLITRLASEVPPQAGAESGPCRGVSVDAVDPDLLGAFLRLLELLEKPEQIPFLAPIIIQEIHYILLIGSQGGNLRKLNTLGSQSNQIAQAVSWLRKNYREPLQVDYLARQVNMATSTFHRHFKEVTGLSPLQFHKRLRLYEAQRLMLVEDEAASSAGLAVGYESVTQFNREYKRLFGEPPHRDMNRRRGIRQ